MSTEKFDAVIVYDKNREKLKYKVTSANGYGFVNGMYVGRYFSQDSLHLHLLAHPKLVVKIIGG